MEPATVISIYMDNVDMDVVEYQRRCVKRLLPPGWDFVQCHSRSSHPIALSHALCESKHDIVILLDIDCIPLKTSSLSFLYERATSGALSGAVQRACHIDNNNHLYVGPFCMAFSKSI